MKRHKIIWGILLRPVRVFLKLKFGYKYEIAKNLPENYIVLSNHVTDYDPLLVGVSFNRQMYFVGSEHIARWKRFYKLLNYALAPIMRSKGTVASSTVVDILRKVRAGENVCIFAEGVRSWDGLSSPILPSTGKMIKSAKCGLVTYKITGGYFVSPMWSKNLRRGPISGAVNGIYTKEQLAEMSVDEINEIIRRDLYEDAYERQLAEPKRYKGKALAEGMENLLFVCPNCKKLDTIYSKDNSVKCKECGFGFDYNEYGMLENAPFTTVRELAAWQKSEVEQAVAKGDEYTAGQGRLLTVVKHEETVVSEGRVILSPQTFICGDTSISVDSISDMAMHGKRALVFTANNVYYEMIPEEGFNTLKFQLYYEAYKGMQQKTVG